MVEPYLGEPGRPFYLYIYKNSGGERPFYLYIYRLCFFSNFNKYQIFSICFWIFPISDSLLHRLTALLTVTALMPVALDTSLHL